MSLRLYALDDFYFCLRVIVQAGNVVLEKEKMPSLVLFDICIQLDAGFSIDRSRYQSTSKAAGKAESDLC